MIEKLRNLSEQFRQKGNGVYKSETVMVTVKTANVSFELSQKEDVFIEQDGTIIIPPDINHHDARLVIEQAELLLQ